MLSTEYLSNVATLLKMTTHYETKLEEQRIRMSLTPHFQARTVYNQLAIDTKGIMREQIQGLFSNFMLNINDKELDYFFQLYSSDNIHINWEDFHQLICPIDMNLDENIHDNQNQQIITDLLFQFQRLVKIEIAYFRQAEPIRMILFEKHKENGKQFCTLVEDHQKNITNLSLINFMKKQQYTFNNQDLFCLKKRIRCQTDTISTLQFIKNCPIIPFQVMISRQPDYKLIIVRQPVPEIFQQPECYVPQIPEIYVAPPQQREEIPPLALKPLTYQEKSNYEFFTGKKPTDRELNQYKSQENLYTPATTQQYYQQQEKNNYLMSQVKSQNYLSPYQTLQNEQTLTPKDNLLDKFMKQTEGPFTAKQAEISNRVSLTRQPIQQSPQLVKTAYLPEVPQQQEQGEDILNKYLYPEKKLEQTIDKFETSQVRKYKIFDDVAPSPIVKKNMDSLQSKSHEESKQAEIPQYQQKQQIKSKKYVSGSMSQVDKSYQ